MRYLVILIFFIFPVGDVVTLNGYRFDLKLELPSEDYNQSFKNRTEGTLYYFSFPDSTAVIVQCMSNTVKSPAVKNIIKSDTVSLNGNLIFRYYGVEMDENHLWREDIYRDIDLSIRIRNASKPTFEVYEKILDTASILPKKS